MRFINDKFKKVRGGYSRLLEISCEECGEYICKYQKDGPGILKRMYWDRILEPSFDSKKQEMACFNGHILGVKTTYKKENRLAYRLFAGAISKRIIKQHSV